MPIYGTIIWTPKKSTKEPISPKKTLKFTSLILVKKQVFNIHKNTFCFVGFMLPVGRKKNSIIVNSSRKAKQLLPWSEKLILLTNKIVARAEREISHPL